MICKSREFMFYHIIFRCIFYVIVQFYVVGALLAFLLHKCFNTEKTHNHLDIKLIQQDVALLFFTTSLISFMLQLSYQLEFIRHTIFLITFQIIILFYFLADISDFNDNVKVVLSMAVICLVNCQINTFGNALLSCGASCLSVSN